MIFFYVDVDIPCREWNIYIILLLQLFAVVVGSKCDFILLGTLPMNGFGIQLLCFWNAEASIIHGTGCVMDDAPRNIWTSLILGNLPFLSLIVPTFEKSIVMGWLNDDAQANISKQKVTCDVSIVIGWLNDDAQQNMQPISVTCDVSIVMGWLNNDAPRNMCFMLVTFDVSIVMGWLNDDAFENMQTILITLEVSIVMGWLNDDANKNM